MRYSVELALMCVLQRSNQGRNSKDKQLRELLLLYDEGTKNRNERLKNLSEMKP